MPFQKGQSGNPGGRRKEKVIHDALVLELNREAEGADGVVTKNVQLVARALVEKAKSGDVQAIKEVADRVDGKVPQAIGSPQGEDGIGPLVVEIVRFGEAPPSE